MAYNVMKLQRSGPTNDTFAIEFEMRPKCEVLWFTDYNEIVHTSQQCNCRDMCKMTLWLI